MKSRAILSAGAWIFSFIRLFATDPLHAVESKLETESALELSPLKVSGEFPAEGWVYTRIDQTEFLSQLSEKQTASLADDFVIFQDFVRANYPEAALSPDYPVTVVVFKNSGDYHRFGGSTLKDSTNIPKSDRYILVDGSQSLFVDKSIRRRWVQQAFKQHPAGRFPLWRDLGTREILANVVIKNDRLVIGYPPTFGPTRFGIGGLMPMQEMFSLSRQSPGYRYQDVNPDAGFPLYAQSTAFMHLCLFAKTHRFREPYQKFVTRLEKEPLSEKLFRDCFHLKYEQMEGWLWDYAIVGSTLMYETRTYRFPPNAPFNVRPAKPAEVLRLLRECLRLSAPP